MRAFGGPRCATVFAYLAMNNGRAVLYGELATAVWAQDRPPTWAAALRSVISKVRQLLTESDVLAGSTLTSRSGALLLSLAPSVQVDLELARRHLDVSEDSAALDRAHRASRLLGLLAAPALEGLHSPWADEVRGVFDRIRLRALEVDAVAAAELGRHDHALRRSQELLEADPFCEEAYRVAMRAHAALGNRARALGVAQQCRTVLANELGVEMSAETQAVFSELLVDPVSVDVVADRHEPEQPAGSDAAAVAVPRRSDPHSPGNVVVGVERELRMIENAITAASAGRAQLVVVAGEAGAGKSTLVAEAVRRAAVTGADVLVGRCSMNALIPFEPFIDAFVRESDPHSHSTGHGASAGQTILSMLTTGWGGSEKWSAEGPEADHRSMLVAAVEHWLTGPDRGPVTVFVVDDLQWASPATLSVLRYLLHSAAHRRLCVVVTVRGTGRSHSSTDALRSALPPSEVTSVGVSALVVEDVAEWVRRVGSDLDPLWLHGWTSGLPILVEAVLDARRRDPNGPSPSSLDDAVLWLLHRLTPTARDIVTACAIAGSNTARDVVRHAVDCTDMQFVVALDELVDAGLVGAVDNALTMRHALIVDVVDGTVSGTTRAAVHSALAVALISVGATSTVDELARVADHLERGLDADRAASADFLRRAGDRSYSVAAYEDAAEFYRRALAASIPRGHTRTRCELLIGRGRAQRRALDREYRATLFEAVDMAHGLGDLDLLVDALTSDVIDGIALFQLYEPDSTRLSHLYAGLDALDRAGRGRTAAVAELLTQTTEEMTWTSSGWSHRAAQLARATQIGRSTDRAALMHALRAVLTGLRVPAYRDERRAAVAELQTLVDTEQRPLDPSLAVTLARAHLEMGDTHAAGDALDMVSGSRLAIDTEASWTVQYMRVGLLVTTGDLGRAETIFENAVREPPPAPMGLHTWGRDKTALLQLRMFRGGLGEIAAMREDMAPKFDAIPAYRGAIALSLFDIGDVDDAREIVGWFAYGRLGALPDGILWLTTVVLAARAAALTRVTSVCEEALDLLAPYAEHTIVLTPGVLGVVDHHLAHVCMALGRWDEARSHVVNARELHGQRGFRVWEAESLLLAAQIDMASGQEIDPEHLQTARSIAYHCGATALLDRIDDMQVPCER